MIDTRWRGRQHVNKGVVSNVGWLYELFSSCPAREFDFVWSFSPVFCRLSWSELLSFFTQYLWLVDVLIIVIFDCHVGVCLPSLHFKVLHDSCSQLYVALILYSLIMIVIICLANQYKFLSFPVRYILNMV